MSAAATSFPGSAAPAPVTVTPARSLNGWTCDAVVEEVHQLRSQITDHPVESGNGFVSDNMVDLPNEVIVTYGWGMSSPQNSAGTSSFLRGIMQAFVQLKASKQLFELVTGKAVYENMVVETISETTDKQTENCLQLRILCRQIIIVNTTQVTVPIDPGVLANQTIAQGTLNRGFQAVKQNIWNLRTDPAKSIFFKPIPIF